MKSTLPKLLVGMIEHLSRRKKQLIAVVADAVMLPVALWSALALRLGEISPDVAQFWPAFVASVVICLPVFLRLGLYRQVVRYMGNHAMLAVVKGVTITALGISLVAYMTPLPGFPRSVPIIFWLLSLAYVGGTRFGVRSYFNWLAQRFRAKAPVVIYGAGVERRRTRADAAATRRSRAGRVSRRRPVAAAAHHQRRLRLSAAVVAGAVERHAGARSARRRAVHRRGRSQTHHRIPRTVRGTRQIDSRPRRPRRRPDRCEHARRRGRRSAGARRGHAVAASVVRLCARQRGAGHRRRRLDRLGAVAPDRARRTAHAGAARSERIRPLRNPSRVAQHRRTTLARRADAGGSRVRSPMPRCCGARSQSYQIDTVYHAAAYKHVEPRRTQRDSGSEEQHVRHAVRGRSGARSGRQRTSS